MRIVPVCAFAIVFGLASPIAAEDRNQADRERAQQKDVFQMMNELTKSLEAAPTKKKVPVKTETKTQQKPIVKSEVPNKKTTQKSNAIIRSTPKVTSNGKTPRSGQRATAPGRLAFDAIRPPAKAKTNAARPPAVSAARPPLVNEDRRAQQNKAAEALMGLMILGAAMNGGGAFGNQAESYNQDDSQFDESRRYIMRREADQADREGAPEKRPTFAYKRNRFDSTEA